MTAVLVMLGGCFGAVARFAVSEFARARFRTTFPAATLFVNLLGSFLLGVLITSGLDASWQSLLGTGFLGAFTTFSTFNLENVRLWREKKKLTAYLAVSYLGGLLLAFFGFLLGA
ncbi:MAG TPA: fluoride efflux transporter CrcB [Bacillales bacterium]|nr:fluoride efflux transporter CrcB [Bacillales bacterium]